MPTPMEIPGIHSFDDLLGLVRDKVTAKKPGAALVVPTETDTLPAFLKAASEGLIDPTIVGDERALKKSAEKTALDLDGVKLIDVNQPQMAIQTAAKMAEAGEIDLIVQGRVDWDDLVSVLTDDGSSFVSRGKILSQVGVLKPVMYPKLLMITDGLGHERPDLKTKIGILGNLGRVAESIGLPNPKTAVVTAVEVIYPQMPATTDGAVLAKMSERGQIKGVLVDGPLSFDVATDADAAESKGISGSVVAGQADAMLASTKQVAQGIYHAMSLYAECDTGAVLVGGCVPVAVNSLTDSIDARFNSIVLATLLARN